MNRSRDRFLTTHTGSLPRPEDLIRMMFAKEEGIPVGPRAPAHRIREPVADIVRRQSAAGVDIVNDGEMSKPSYATYIKDRLHGFGGESVQQYFFADLVAFPRRAGVGAAHPAPPPPPPPAVPRASPPPLAAGSAPRPRATARSR